MPSSKLFKFDVQIFLDTLHTVDIFNMAGQLIPKIYSIIFLIKSQCLLDLVSGQQITSSRR